MSRRPGDSSVFGVAIDSAIGKKVNLGGKVNQHEKWAETILPADAEAVGTEGETNRRPLMLFAAVIVFACSLLAAKAFALQVVHGGRNLALADGNRIRLKLERAPRGVIYDRNHQPLVRNQASFDVVVIPQQLPREAKDRNKVYAAVGAITGTTPETIRAHIEGDCRAGELAYCLSLPLPKLVLAGIPRDQALAFEQASTSLTGFSLDVNPIREYLDGGTLASILGYTGRVSAEELDNNDNLTTTDYIGKLGLELQYQNELSGQSGGEQTEVDALGTPVKILAAKPSVPGNNLVLHIDNQLEIQFRDAIQRQMVASGAKRAAGVAVDPRNGAVLAVVSLPSYDNNLFSRGISAADYARLTKDPGQPLFNKVISGAFPSGSIIKPFGALAGLQEGIITPNTVIQDSGKIEVPNQFDPTKPPAIYHGWERDSGLGPMTVVSALAQSSDIFFYEMAGGLVNVFTRYLGVNKLTDWYQRFGLGSRTGIDLPSEAKGRVPTPAWKKDFSGDDWYTGDTYNISVGQGDMLVSPLQMVMAVSAIANGGTLYRPHLVSQITDASGTVLRTIEPEVVRSGLGSAANLATVRRGMREAVTNPKGTACCRIDKEVPVPVAAKTGTAETVVTDTGDKTGQNKPHAWFEAFAPFDNPTIAMVVLVEHSGEGAEYAAPAARETLTWYFTQGAGAKR